MSAPTNVRVEAQSLTSAILRWSYSGTSNITVYRSTDGSSYAEVTDSASRIEAGTTSYTDTTLSTGTKYWYKLSDDAGSTFSSVVTVYAMFCGSGQSSGALQLPQASGDTPSADDFNELSQKVEAGFVAFTNGGGQTCVACVTDGAVNLDCINYAGCQSIVVTADQDINSISLPDCLSFESISFDIPANTTRRIGGWPAGSGFTGDEGFQAPIITGATPLRATVQRKCKCADIAQGAVGVTPGFNCLCEFEFQGTAPLPATSSGGATCTCVPGTNGALTIKSCNAKNSLDCSGSKSLRLIACGGRGPYTWSKTGSITLQVGDNGTAGTTAAGPSIVVKPPTNSGSGVAGDAYWIVKVACEASTGGASDIYKVYTCADVLSGGVQTAVASTLNCPDAGHQSTCPSRPRCVPANPSGTQCNCGGGNFSGQTGLAGSTYCDPAGGFVCDKRTGTMVSNGCNPCGLQSGSTVTVTDALGTQATIVLRA